MLGLVTSVLSFFKEYKSSLYILGSTLLIIVFIGMCNKYKNAVEEADTLRKETVINLRASRDASQKQILRVESQYEKDLVLKDSTIKSYLDSLNIKQRQINSLRSIAFSKTTEKIVPEYRTVYELIEVENDIPKRFSVVHDNCITLRGEFTPQGLRTVVEKDIQILEINYTKRRRFLGLTWTPRIGKKETYQTLITNCGDTLTKNKLLIFEK